MKIETKQIETLIISEVKNLDPVTVNLDDKGEGAGKITIECYGKSWSSYWGSMGTDLKSFVISCDNHYLIRNFAPCMEAEVTDIDQVQKDADAKDVSFHGDINDESNLYDIYAEGDGYGWQYEVPKTKNHEYEYLERILDAVKQAMQEAK